MGNSTKRRAIPKILKQSRDTYGYLMLELGGKPQRMHVLVAHAFIGPRPDGLDVCHNDGDRANNQPSNLRYDTRKGNLADRNQHGTNNAGERNGRARLGADDVLEIRLRFANGEPFHAIHEDYPQVTAGAIRDIQYCRNWKHITLPTTDQEKAA
jgi:hypothetical protein